jgi:membrane protease subunit HflK
MSTVSKIIIDQKSSNSLLYLPLDKIIQNSNKNNDEELDLNKASNQRNPDVSASDVINSLTDRSRGALRARERDIR